MPDGADLAVALDIMVHEIDRRGTTLVQLRTEDRALLTLQVSSSGRLTLRNDVTGEAQSSGIVLAPREWVTVELHLRWTGRQATVDVWYEGVHVDQLSGQQSLDDVQPRVVRIGEVKPNRHSELVIDDVAITDACIRRCPQSAVTTNTATPSGPEPTLVATAEPTRPHRSRPTPQPTSEPTPSDSPSELGASETPTAAPTRVRRR